MTEQWTEAELIPTAGIKGALEQERRATSALLAVMRAVTEFGRAITKALGAPVGKLETYIEVPMEIDGKRCTPDGLIRVTRGSKTWTMLVETKTGNNILSSAQLETYLDVARQQGFDGVLTISNEIPPVFGTHPTAVDKRKLRGNIVLRHLSWTWILTEAVLQKTHRGIADPDQAWILSELIRYLEHPRSGVVEFDDMGESWTAVRDAVRAGTLRATDRGAGEVALRWDQLVRFASLRLGRQLGADVQPILARREREDLAHRAQRVRETLQSDGVLDGGLRIPNTAGPVWIRADVRARQLVCSTRIEAPKTGRQRTRVNWLTRQLPDASGILRIDSETMHSRGPGRSALLQAVRADPDVLVEDPKRDIKAFTIAMVAPMGVKRGNGRGSFVESVLHVVDDFYADVVQNLKEWSADPPRLTVREEPSTESDGPSSGELPEFPPAPDSKRIESEMVDSSAADAADEAVS
jgi:hypothetical protein